MQTLLLLPLGYPTIVGRPYVFTCHSFCHLFFTGLLLSQTAEHSADRSISRDVSCVKHGKLLLILECKDKCGMSKIISRTRYTMRN